MHTLKSVFAKLAYVLTLYGGWGLFVISFLDSSFLSFPLVNDLLLIHLASQFPRKALFYALESTLGSVLGASVVYVVAREGGRFLWRKTSPRAINRVRQWAERNEFAAILVASLLPPPVPFKLFAISAGIIRVNFSKFCLALAVGRGVRFIAGALLGAHFGAPAEAYVKANFGWASLAIAVSIALLAILYRRVSDRMQHVRCAESGPPSTGPANPPPSDPSSQN